MFWGQRKIPPVPPLIKGGTFFCGLGCGDATGCVQLCRSGMCGDVTGSDVAPTELRRFRLVGCGLQICRSYGAQEATLPGLPGTKKARLYKQKASLWWMRAGTRFSVLRATATRHFRQRVLTQVGKFREKTHNIGHLNPPKCHDTPDVRPFAFFPASPFIKEASLPLPPLRKGD